MFNNMPLSIQGVPVTIVEPVLVGSTISRTWKERLFTRPFTPFVATKEIMTLTDVIEDGQILKTDQGLIMSAKTFNDCEKAIFEKNTNKKFCTMRG